MICTLLEQKILSRFAQFSANFFKLKGEKQTLPVFLVLECLDADDDHQDEDVL